jgi:hypothetical protein
VRDLGQRVGLVHELRQLAGTEELLDGRADRLGVDQVVRHQVVGFGLRQALLDGTLDTHQTGAELVLGQFADRAHTAVAEVVDVVDLARPLRRSTRILMTATMSSFRSASWAATARGYRVRRARHGGADGG